MILFVFKEGSIGSSVYCKLERKEELEGYFNSLEEMMEVRYRGMV